MIFANAFTAHRRQRAAAVLVLLAGTGCAHQAPVERLVDGRVVRGPAISEVAYAAYLEGSIAQEEGKREKAREAFALAEAEDEQLREWNQQEALTAAMSAAPSLSPPTGGSALALVLANPTLPRGWLQVVRDGNAQERAWAGCELAHRWPRFAKSLEPVALQLAKEPRPNEARMLAFCVATRAADPAVKALALDEAIYAQAAPVQRTEHLFDVASRLRMNLADVLVRAYAVLGPIRSAALFARAATFAPAAVQEAEATVLSRDN
jgi:hypothetical protein